MRHLELTDSEKTVLKNFINKISSVELEFDKNHPYVTLKTENEVITLPTTFLEISLLSHHDHPESQKIYVRDLIMHAYPELI